MSAGTGGMEPVVLIGAGRAGRALSAALQDAGVTSVLVDREGIVSQHAVDVRTRADAIARAHVLLLAVRDGQLNALLHDLLALPVSLTGRTLLQVSGSAEPVARAAITEVGAHYGTFHPLLPLLEPERARARLRGAVIGIEGDATSLAAASALASRFEATTIAIPRAQRAAYHAAAVIASNFPVTLAALAEGLLARIGVDAAAAHRAVRALMAASVENLDGATRALDALTGPIARHDVATVRAHVDALHGMDPIDAVYATLSHATVALLRARGDDPTSLRALEAMLPRIADVTSDSVLRADT